MKIFSQYILSTSMLLLMCSAVQAFTEEQLKWLESDAEHPLVEINEGELKFLEDDSKKPEHVHENRIVLNEGSIQTGWAHLHQCHYHLDKVPALEIVYHQDRIRNLKVTSYENITSAKAGAYTVDLRDISDNSKICIQAESRIIHPVEGAAGKQFDVVNGPFMRKFLDGFYPLTVKLVMEYPYEVMSLKSVLPGEQVGWQVQQKTGLVRMHGRFEGRLMTRLRFELKSKS